MKDIKLMIDFIKELSNEFYDREVFFYDFENDVWYSRIHCRDVELEEVLDWTMATIHSEITKQGLN